MKKREIQFKIKLSFISGLKEIVLNEINKYKDFRILEDSADSFYLDFVSDLSMVKNLKSVSRAYLVTQDVRYNPLYISNHKSVLDALVEIVIKKDKNNFRTFNIACAGSDSLEVRGISEYIQKKYRIKEADEADLKIHIIKQGEIWEIGVQITPRPLSLRNYKIKHMSGAMDPTVAYAMNFLCELENKNSYLNVFSGSATLLIEAGIPYPNLKSLIGFDNNKKHISLAIQNIKEAGLIKNIQIKEADIFDKPDLGKFDIITSDLPFGMVVSKNENLEDLYKCFIEYCENTLNDDGKMVVYTSEHELLKKIILESKFKITKVLELKFITAVGAYLYPKVFVCRFI